MSQNPSGGRSGRRRLTKSWKAFVNRVKSWISHLPPNTPTAIIFVGILGLGIYGAIKWTDDPRPGLALSGLGLAGIAWYGWNARHRLFRRHKVHRSRRR